MNSSMKVEYDNLFCYAFSEATVRYIKDTGHTFYEYKYNRE